MVAAAQGSHAFAGRPPDFGPSKPPVNKADPRELLFSGDVTPAREKGDFAGRFFGPGAEKQANLARLVAAR
jgi:hypothetical protein